MALFAYILQFVLIHQSEITSTITILAVELSNLYIVLIKWFSELYQFPVEVFEASLHRGVAVTMVAVTMAMISYFMSCEVTHIQV